MTELPPDEPLLTDAQVEAIREDPQVSEDLRSLCPMALAGNVSARWMLGKAVDAGAIVLRVGEVRAWP